MEAEQQQDELRLSLLGHLKELRTRLFRVAIAVVILGLVSLAFSKDLFRFLMAPVLQALPEGEQALIQTSAIEELNTFMKVGIYAGLFFAAPVVLSQVWGFIAPGLYAHERRMAVPFVAAGTACFLLGASFCYFVVLPPAFEFLLKPDEIRSRQVELRVAQGQLDDVGRLLRAGDLAGASELLEAVEAEIPSVLQAGSERQLLLERIEHLGVLLDAAERRGADAEPLREAVHMRGEARNHLLAGQFGKARSSLERAEQGAAQALARAFPAASGDAEAFAQRHVAAGERLARASSRLTADDWTKPMLSMREQLQLVLLLLIAFGLIFEIPVVFALLGALGIVDGSELAKVRRHAIVANVILAAVITPTGDPFNLALMAIPMILCYEVGIFAARFTSRRRRAREEAALAA